MHRPVRAWGFFVSIALFTTIFIQQHSRTEPPDQAGPCQIAVEAVTQDGMAIDIYYPQGGCMSALDAPYPAIAYAHGFSFFGLSDGAGDNSGNGKHLASWGYVVAVPALPDDAELRIENIIQVLDLLAAANEDTSSFLYKQVDLERFAVAGHSLGGATALAVTARDARIKAVVALDPVYHARTILGGEYPVWNPADEGPTITVPVSILGAPADACNSQADFEEIYPFVGSTHKASFVLVNSSHCVFADPGNSGCDLLCGGDTGAKLTQLSQKYMTAWLNYYLHEQPDDYADFYGTGSDADIDSGKIRRTVSTSPRDLVTYGISRAVELQWTVYEQPMVAGYQIYRRQPGQSFPENPLASTGLSNSYIDSQVSDGQTYIYKLHSYDPAGNLHQESREAMATPNKGGFKIWMPFLMAS